MESPIWVKPEWALLASERLTALGEAYHDRLIDLYVKKTQRNINQIDESKQFLKRAAAPPEAETEPDLLALLPVALRDRVLTALQPPTHEVLGFAFDAERITLERVAGHRSVACGAGFSLHGEDAG